MSKKTMKKTLCAILSFMMCIFVFAGCNEKNEADSVDAVNTEASVVIENQGIETTYDAVPERVVVLSYETAEMMVALGLEDKIVAVASSHNDIEDVKEEYRDTIASLPTFPEEGLLEWGAPTFETILSVEPDFVFGDTYSFRAGNCGEAEDFAANGINIYANIVSYSEKGSFDDIYQTIEELGQIFRVEDRSEELVSELKTRVDAVAQKAKDLEPVKVFVFDTDMENGTVYTTGGINIEDEMIRTAGGVSIFTDLGTKYSEVSLEEIIAQEPDFVFITDYGDAENKIAFLDETKELSEVPAVKNKNYTIFSSLEVVGGLQTFDALEKMFETLHP